jgi:hypothetical protein
MLMDAFDHDAEDAERFAAAVGESWDRNIQIDRESSDHSDASPNPVVRSQGIASRPSMWRQLQAQIRLLRAAVHLRTTGELPDLEDPLGSRLISERKEGRIRIWSRGKDVTNQIRPSDWGSRNRDNPLVVEIPESE